MKIVLLENMNNSKPFETLSHFSRSVPNFLRGGIIIKQARHGRVWQRANGFFVCTAHMFVEPQNYYFIKNFLQFELDMFQCFKFALTQY